MRTAFVKALTELAGSDPRIMLLTGDLGFSVVEEFARAHPRRYLNVGVAEANMIGVATGLAGRGLLPFCYSIATFATMRGYEQLRNGPVLHQLPVRIVGVGGGFAYGTAGVTHHALEDLGLARLLPELAVIAPADDAQAVSALRATWAWEGPVYYRVGKDRISLPELGGRFRPGRIETLGHGRDLLLVTTGALASTAAATAHHLAAEGMATTVAVMAWIQPAPQADLVDLLGRFPTVVTMEDHYLAGGIGSLVAEAVADAGLRPRVIRCGVSAALDGRSGSEAFLRARAGLTPEQVTARVLATVAATRHAA